MIYSQEGIGYEFHALLCCCSVIRIVQWAFVRVPVELYSQYEMGAVYADNCSPKKSFVGVSVELYSQYKMGAMYADNCSPKK